MKKMRKNKVKEASKNAPSNVNMNEFEFVSVEVNDIESRENKRVRNSPQDERRTRQKSDCEIDLC